MTQVIEVREGETLNVADGSAAYALSGSTAIAFGRSSLHAYAGDLNRSERESVQAFIDSIRSEVA